MVTPTNVNYLELDCTCVGIGVDRWDELMQGATHANRAQIDSLVKLHLPELYEELMLNLYNPYDYYKTETHLILVHSSVEYFLMYN